MLFIYVRFFCADLETFQPFNEIVQKSLNINYQDQYRRSGEGFKTKMSELHCVVEKKIGTGLNWNERCVTNRKFESHQFDFRWLYSPQWYLPFKFRIATCLASRQIVYNLRFKTEFISIGFHSIGSDWIDHNGCVINPAIWFVHFIQRMLFSSLLLRMITLAHNSVQKKNVRTADNTEFLFHVNNLSSLNKIHLQNGSDDEYEF